MCELADLVKEWCKGKNWMVRLPVTIWLIYMLIRYLANPNYMSILGYFNYWTHEAGHLLFLPFGGFIEAMSGTMLEWLIPIVFLVAFLFQGEFFGASFCLGWEATCLFYASWYISGAQRTDEWTHDWFNMLSTLGLLQYNHEIAILVKVIAATLMLLSIVSGGWLLWWMFKQPEIT